ncbi:VanZ-like [Acididesulfobacillus acetoxydans]|uniref:VanZ like family n=1 Tax=Acididesulfobacillus acetoxydans TaxID=1561005 RepID=A0A8S0W5G7_9FIRM|nr:VanZ family protein [Acididesulfobacillus acetoxydans]CAA7603128.1 VanZ-like [Acididesulfobacillus acetoxydans]CEJ05634.1 VanZ like family [Acididesulfobacillus acetoxydans]
MAQQVYDNLYYYRGVLDIFSQKTRWILVIIGCVVIFGFTAFPVFTAKNTGTVIEQSTHVPKRDLGSLDFVVRKAAHVTVYAVLALLLFYATGKRALLSYGLATLYAASDEFHQIFVPGRTPAVQDVMLDSAAALVMIIVLRQIRKPHWSS